jgi:hypothetical protein
MIKGSCHCGAVEWSFDGVPETATACNCSVCRRYGTLWAYDYIDERIKISGQTKAYIWGDKELGFHFCVNCGGIAYWKGLEADEQGRTRIAVNLRLAEPDEVGDILIRHFEGLKTFRDLPTDGRTVKDLWF